MEDSLTLCAASSAPVDVEEASSTLSTGRATVRRRDLGFLLGTSWIYSSFETFIGSSRTPAAGPSTAPDLEGDFPSEEEDPPEDLPSLLPEDMEVLGSQEF